MTGFTCQKCGVEKRKLTGTPGRQNWVCDDCKPDPLARLRALLDEVEREYYEVGNLTDHVPTLARVLREVLKYQKRFNSAHLKAAIARGLDDTEGGGG